MIKIKEIWKPIKGYENYYKVSNMGRIKRNVYKKDSIIIFRLNMIINYIHMLTNYEAVNSFTETFRDYIAR